MLSHLSHVPFYVTLWIVAHQVLLSIRFSRQEYWIGLSFSSRNLPDPGIELVPLTSNLHWQVSSLPLAPPDKPRQHIKKQRHHVPNKGPDSKSYGFPVVMYGCESWTVKKAECQRIDAFELWCWRRLLRVPWTTRRSNQSILKEINPEYSLEGLIQKLKLQ